MGKPDDTIPAINAVGPGIDSTVISSSIAVRIYLYAGSLIPGVPASLITAT